MQTTIFQNGIRIVPNSVVLPEDAELWRYMSLSKFLMLLRGKVFIPTIAELRQGDPLEARSRCEQTRVFFDNLHGKDREWLVARGTEDERRLLKGANASKLQKVETLLRIWDRELAERRTLWCWHRANIESMALWHVYGKEGVAIKTTPAQIKEAFDPAFVDTALIAPVAYTSDACQQGEEHHFMRPYLFKQACYKYEQEVRVVFPRDPAHNNGGRSLPIDAQKLISEVRISPFVPRSEAVEIRRSLIQAWKIRDKWRDSDNRLSVFPSDTRTHHEERIDDLKLNQGEPTGITNFGSINMPFVMCGDFRNE